MLNVRGWRLRVPHVRLRMLRRLVKDVVPAPVWAALRDWKHTYPTWEAACRAAGPYDNDLLNRFRAARDSANPVMPLSDDHQISQEISRHGAVRITDLGGGTGGLAKSITAKFSNVLVTVVEHPGLVAIARPSPRVTWSTTIPDACDVFLCGGTLQYLAQPYDALTKGLTSARYAAILTRNSFAEREIFRVQRSSLYRNGAGPIPDGFPDDCPIAYPHRTIVEAKVREIARVLGFVFERAAREDSGVVAYGGQVYGKDLLLRRIQE